MSENEKIILISFSNKDIGTFSWKLPEMSEYTEEIIEAILKDSTVGKEFKEDMESLITTFLFLLCGLMNTMGVFSPQKVIELRRLISKHLKLIGEQSIQLLKE